MPDLTDLLDEIQDRADRRQAITDALEEELEL